MENKNFYKFIIYKLFTSKYKDLFVLDGSYGLYLAVDSENKRILGDLDLNDLSISSDNNDKSKIIINSERALKVFNDIFNPVGIIVEWFDKPKAKPRKYNQNSIGGKLNFLFGSKEISADLSFIFNNKGVITVNWNVYDPEFCNEFSLDYGNKIKIKTFKQEKFFVNKILSTMKITNGFEVEANISKNLYDIWFIIKSNDSLSNTDIKLQYETMMGSKMDLIGIYGSILSNINKWYDNHAYRLKLYIQKSAKNPNINGYVVLDDIVKYLNTQIEEVKNASKKHK